MATMPGTLTRKDPPTRRAAAQGGGGEDRTPFILAPWIDAQSVNLNRHAAALRPFRNDEFGTTDSAPSPGHIQAVNTLLESLRTELLKLTRSLSESAEIATITPTTRNIQVLLRQKETGHAWVRAVEKIWDFYFELFGQRQTRFADWLLSCDRIALNCYQVTYLNIAVTKSLPAPPPFSYMRTGFSPATYRRGIPLRRLGRQLNPFPLVQLPYHRLVNPWTLGAMLHEVSHNLQSDLGLSRAVPRRIAQTLLQSGQGRQVAAVWSRWNRELFADVCGLLLGGPAFVSSLMDVVARSQEATLTYVPGKPHPTPGLRTYVSIELLRRMGFPEEAAQFKRTWARMYPNLRAGSIPTRIVDTFADVNPMIVDAVCYQPFKEIGNKALADVIRFGSKEQHMVEEAARRLAAGTDPGIIPSRFLIGAARFALDNRLTRPGVITKNFYDELSRR
jgi:hypothetical protein